MSRIIINVDTPNTGNGDPLRNAMIAINAMTLELYTGVVFKETGKGLSTNDFTSTLQTKLNGIPADANKNVQADLLEGDNLADSFVKNKEAIVPGQTPTQIETYAGTSTFTLPVGAIVLQVLLVRAVLFEFDEWTQSSNVLTISKTMNTGNRIQITFY
jgi:hypothetical protein